MGIATLMCCWRWPIPKQLHLPCAYTASEILTLCAGQLEIMGTTFPLLDLTWEAHIWAAWHLENGGVKRPVSSFMNWVKKSERHRLEELEKRKNGHGPAMRDETNPKEYARYRRD